MILTRDGKEITTIYSQDGSEIEDLKDANGRIVYLASREITGTLPLSFSSRGKPLTDYLISGNTVQDGTPLPESPVDVVGCGIRTGNLVRNDGVSAEYHGIKYTVNTDKSITVFGTAMSGVSYFIFAGHGAAINNINDYSTPIFKAGETLVFSTNSQMKINARYTDGSYSGAGFKMNDPITLTKDIGMLYIQAISGVSINTTVFPMVNTGSTALPYEPYGYKLPLTVNGTEYPIYLGTVPTTRRIKKLVFDGTEDWEINSVVNYIPYFRLSDTVTDGVEGEVICTHYVSPTNAISILNSVRGIRIQNSDAVGRILLIRTPTNESDTLTNFKSYLAAQYAAGTPVTVWYVLAEPETGIVNEPLHKIGDYADTISFAQAEVIFPTVSGNNILDTTSPVKPSEVYIKGKGIKPTGYGQLVDNNSVRILDKNNVRILVHGQ